MVFDFASNVNIGLIVLGWVVVHFTARYRDLDKTRRDLIVKTVDATNDQIGKIVTTAVTYHGAEKRNIANELELKSSLKDLSNQVRLLDSAIRPKRDSVRSSMLNKSFKQAITASHFEDEHTNSLTSNHEQFSQLAAAGIELKAYLTEIKFAQFD